MDTVADVIPDLKPYAGDAGACSREIILRYLNSARRALWNKTDTRATTGYYCICCAEGCMTLPSEFKRVILAWHGNMPISLGNEWYQSVPQVGILDTRNSCNNKMVQVGGYHVTFQNYGDSDYHIALQAESALDFGKELTITGVDRYGTRHTEVHSLVNPPDMTSSAKLYKAPLIVIKARTTGRVRMYAVDPNNGKKMLLAVYQPYDENPSFEKFKVPNCGQCLTIYAKKKYFDLVADNELVEFTPEALIHAVSAIVNRENKGADAIQQYVANMNLAVGEVNRETADIEEDVGSPMRVFAPDNVDNLNPGYGYVGGTYYGGVIR